tara:strand:- start:148 stop:927 length:780 start_codon:yes stop_codon:yes gene_type:complete
MKFWLQIITILIIIIIASIWAKPVFADDTNSQTNSSGSNTNITGGYTTTNNNTYATGSSNDTTSTTNNDTDNTTNNNSKVPPPSANAPSYSSMSQDVCSMGISGSVTTGIVGIAGGKHYTDENCERIKLAKVLQDFGMKVASVAILCQDSRVFSAMEAAGTPCPWEGKIGKNAAAMWEQYPEIRPDYEVYLAKLKIKDKKDAKVAKEIEDAEEEAREEEERIAEEEAKKAEEEAEKRKEVLKKIEEAKERKEITIHVDR